jgi:6-phosphogluconate dehydrogenase
MLLIADAYGLLKRGYRLSTAEIADLFAEWNEGELNSFLIEITSTVLRKIDSETGQPLVDLIVDTAAQKGTGKWTSQTAAEFGVPIPSIDAAVTMRQISARKAERIEAAKKLGMPGEGLFVAEELRDSTIEFVRDGLHLAFIVTYAQGMSLLAAASAEKGFDLDLIEIAKIWRGGCIIRAALLEDIRKAYEAEPQLPNLLVSDIFVPTIRREQSLLKAFVHFAISTDVPCMGAAASLNYLKAYSSAQLPANLVQAQRDYFGAHTYLRTDKEGIFHTPDWEE